MNVLIKYLNIEDIEEMTDSFNKSVFQKLDEKNVDKIIQYLKANDIYFYEDILIYYLDLFLFDASEFIRRFETLKIKHPNLTQYLEANMDVLEEMYQ